MHKPLLKENEIQDLDWDKYQQMTGVLTRINRADLDSEMEELPAIYSYYHGLMIRSKSLYDEATNALEETAAEIRHEQRKSGVKITAIAGEDLVKCHPDVKDLNTLLTQRKEVYSLLKSLCDALNIKKDMLVQLSANQRQETKLYSNG